MVVDEPAGAEINATGRVVYGYNLRVMTAGEYVIEYTFPDVDIEATDAGTVTKVLAEDGTTVLESMVSLTITVGGGGGGGGGGRRP